MTGKKSAIDAMTREYRIYKFSSDDYIQGVPAVIVCKNDIEALAEAKKLLDGLDLEVWEGARCVTRLESQDAEKISWPGAPVGERPGPASRPRSAQTTDGPRWDNTAI